MKLVKKSRPKIGLALSSGAALGIAHIGVIKAFQEAEIPVDIIAGTSMGAIIGACFAKEGEIKEVEDEALRTDWRRFTRLLDPNIAYLRKGLIHGQRIQNLLRSIIGDIDFKDLKIPFAVVATDINTGKEIVIREGSVIAAVRASFSIPGIFVPVVIKENCLVDGGTTNPVPTDVLTKMGAKFIIAVNVLHDPIKREVFKSTVKNKVSEPPNIFNTLIQSIYIMENTIVKLKAPEADVIIEPDVSHLESFEFYRGKEAIEAGYTAAMKSIPQISKLIWNQ